MKGLNEFVALSIILAIAISGIVISMEFLKPVLDKTRDSFIVNEAISNMVKMKNAIEDLSREGEGSKRLVNLKISDGFIIFDENAETINFTYKLKGDVYFSGNKSDVNINTERGEVKIFTEFKNVNFTNRFYLYSGTNSLMLKYDKFENGKIKISISE
ncbi:MAG: hypothetical protein N3E38_00665 [Candidatus Aenigmarchaeota archaeon]|nr:hypothetical protein [Candidatus Aenigmarchaeota archaeon]